MTSASAGKTFGWYLWRRCRIATAVTASTVAMTGFLGRLSPPLALETYVLMAFATVYLMASLTMTDPQDQGPSGYPAQLFFTPLSDRALAMWPMAIVAIGTGLLGMAMAGLATQSSFGSEDLRLGLNRTWWLAPYLAGNATILQALSWIPIQNVVARMSIRLAPGLFIVGGPALIAFGLASPWAVSLFYGVAVPVSMGIAANGISRARHEITGKSSPKASRYEIREVGPFQSRLDAQVWLELKRNGLVIKVLFCICIPVFLAVGFIAIHGSTDSVTVGGKQVALNALVHAGLLLLMVWLSGSCGCCGSERDNVGKDRGLNPFMAQRPLASWELVKAKVAMVVSLIAKLALIPPLLSLGVLMIPSPANPDGGPTLPILVHAVTWQQAVTAGLIYMLMVVGSMKSAISSIWASLGRVNPAILVTLTLVPIIGSLWVGGYMAFHIESLPQVLEWLSKLVWVFVILKITILVGAVIPIRRERLVPDLVLWKWGLGSTLGAMVMFGIGCWLVPASAYGRAPMAAQIFLFLPLARMALAPLMVHRNRHR